MTIHYEAIELLHVSSHSCPGVEQKQQGTSGCNAELIHLLSIAVVSRPIFDHGNLLLSCADALRGNARTKQPFVAGQNSWIDSQGKFYHWFVVQQFL